jgi:Prp8 binding protein
MDNSLRVWDIKPYVAGGDESKRCSKIFTGVQHNFEKNLLRCAWNYNDSLISAGSADRMVYIWDVDTGHMVNRLGGHHGSVNETCFHPDRNILASCSSDKTIYLGDLTA